MKLAPQKCSAIFITFNKSVVEVVASPWCWGGAQNIGLPSTSLLRHFHPHHRLLQRSSGGPRYSQRSLSSMFLDLGKRVIKDTHGPAGAAFCSAAAVTMRSRLQVVVRTWLERCVKMAALGGCCGTRPATGLQEPLRCAKKWLTRPCHVHKHVGLDGVLSQPNLCAATMRSRLQVVVTCGICMSDAP